jgi:ABC-type transport system involved in multi-copper enzyme maturation permease subunit
MKTRFKQIISLLRIEFGISYRFPIIEGIVAIIFFTIFMNSMTGGRAIHFNVGDSERYTTYMNYLASNRLYVLLTLFLNLMIFLAPLLVAIVIAKPLEDDYARTLLTYPISRSKFLSIKAILICLIPYGLISTALLSAILLIYPMYPTNFELILVLSSILLFLILQNALSTLIAVVTQNMSATAVAGIGIWFVITIILGIEGMHPVLTTIFHPLKGTLGFIIESTGSPVLGELLLGFSGSVLLSITLFIFSYAIFKKAEI